MIPAFIHIHTRTHKFELLLSTRCWESKDEKDNKILSLPNELTVKWEVDISNQTLHSKMLYEREVKDAVRIPRRNT